MTIQQKGEALPIVIASERSERGNLAIERALLAMTAERAVNKNMENLIILHGWGSSKEKWQEVKLFIEKQKEDGPPSIRIVVMDLPGFKKETALSRAWDLDDYVEWFKEFSAKIDGQFFLLGHSFGGRIAIKYAARNPERLKGLILVAAAGIIPEKRLSRAALGKIAKFGKMFSCLPFYKLLRKGFYKYILRSSDYIQAEKLPHLKETFKNVIQEDLRKYFARIKTRCLIIWGDKDNMTPLSDGKIMAREIPNARMEILPGIGHFPYTQSPELLAEKIVKFVSWK